jgi:7SK snRNA methylphosphate capping enzyme
MIHGESGNYRGYYKYRPLTSDHRITLLAECTQIDFNGKVVLDIGSNEGSFTLAVAERFQPKLIVGIEPDNRLTESALASLNRSIHRSKNASETENSKKEGISSVKTTKPICNFKPRSVSQASRRTTSTTTSDSAKIDIICNGSKAASSLFPNNVQFHCKGYEDMKSTGAYDIVLCLSVSKWIHLNEGDEGLNRFFRQLLRLCKPGGLVVLEYQPWKSYINNSSASPHIQQVFPTLQLRPEDFEKILTHSVGFTMEARLGPSLPEAKGFNRPILVLRRPLSPLSSSSSSSSSSSASSSIKYDKEVNSIINNADITENSLESRKTSKKRKKRDSNGHDKDHDSGNSNSNNNDAIVGGTNGVTPTAMHELVENRDSSIEQAPQMVGKKKKKKNSGKGAK